MPRSNRIIYVMQEYPVTTQTFVENEAIALEKLGHQVIRYPLRASGVGARPKNVVTRKEILTSPARWVPLLVGLAVTCFHWRAVRSIMFAEKPQLKDLSRQLYALWHALVLYTYVHSEREPVHFVHAHFLGRCSDVAVYLRILTAARSLKFSATGHAGDVTNPGTPNRLKRQVQYLDGVVCASRAVADALELWTGRRATGVIHCGVRPAGMLDRLSTTGALRILSVGRLVEKKGFQDAMMAALQLNAAGRAFEWRIVGAGPLEEELLEASIELVRSGKVEWLGAMPSQAVLDLLTSWADLFVLPCRMATDGDSDGIPVALMEAMAAGVPVISSRVAGIPELISSGVTGYLIEPGDVQQLAEYIGVLFDNEPERAKIAAAGQAFVNLEFNLELEAKKMSDLLFRAVPEQVAR